MTAGAGMIEIRPGYKQTEVGVIPEDWEVKRVCEFGKIVTGGTPPTNVKKYWNGNIPWATPTDITQEKDIYYTNTFAKNDLSR